MNPFKHLTQILPKSGKAIEKYLIHHKKYIISIAINLTALFIISIALQFSGIFEVQRFINLELFAWTLIALDAVALGLYKRETKGIIAKDFFKNGFLILLLILVSERYFNIRLLNILDIYQFILVIIFAVIIFYDNQQSINDTEIENKQEQLEEQRRKKKFTDEYPKISKIWGLQWIVRWMYAKGWIYGSILLLIVLIGFGLRIWNLGQLGLTFDEGIGWCAVEGIAKTGMPILLSGSIYLRGIPYYYLNALIVSLFGISEFTLRIVSVLSGTGSIILFYFMGKKVGIKKYFLLWGIAFLSFHYWTITMSRWGRMYMFTAFFIVLTLYIFLRLIESRTIRDYILFFVSGSISVLSHNTGYVVFLYIPAYFLVSFLRRRNRVTFIKENIRLILTFIILSISFVLSTIVFTIGNIDTSLGSGNRTLIESLIRSLHLGSFKFNNYLFIQDQFGILIIPLLLTTIYVISFSKIWRMEKSLILYISLLIFIITLFGPGLGGGRIIFFQIFFYLLSFLIIIQTFTKGTVLKLSVLSLLLILLLPNLGFNVPFIDYGSKVTPKYSSSHVIDFYPDNKNPSIEVFKLSKENDTIIFYGLPVRSYPYLNRAITYENFYSVSKKKQGRVTSTREFYTNTTIIYDYDNLCTIIENSRGDIYLVTTFSILSYSEKQPKLYHFRPYMLNNILEKYQPELLFKSDDNVSALYRITNSSL